MPAVAASPGSGSQPWQHPTHLAVPHAGGRGQRPLQRLAPPGHGLLWARGQPGQAQQELQDGTVPSQGAVHQSTLAPLVCKVGLGGEKATAEVTRGSERLRRGDAAGTRGEQLPLLTSRRGDIWGIPAPTASPEQLGS